MTISSSCPLRSECALEIFSPYDLLPRSLIHISQCAGFLSIDCGSSRNYTDDTGLEWEADYGTFVNVGKSFEMPSQNSSVSYYDSPINFTQALTTFRYFDEGRSKYCYELPTSPNSSYLIRAMFYLNESSLKVTQPVSGETSLFIVSVNATAWFSIAGGDDSTQEYFVIQEGIFYSPGSVISICLQPVIGVPFINSLELRRSVSRQCAEI
jgi:hypothetical protein